MTQEQLFPTGWALRGLARSEFAQHILHKKFHKTKSRTSRIGKQLCKKNSS